MPKSQFHKYRELSPAVRMAIAVLAISATLASAELMILPGPISPG